MAKTISIKQEAAEHEEVMQENPFPGLRPFNNKEKHLYYGREGQSEKVLELLTKNRFVAVVGPSGSGKSSLINCGIIPQLFGGYLYAAGSRWKIARMHPGYSPIESLAITLTDSFASAGRTPDQLEADTNLNYVLFTKKALEISTIVKKIENYNNENVLIFIDQFEELFRFTSGLDTRTEHGDEPLLLINLLINALQQKKIPIYVIICIRSDFVGSCTNYQKLTDFINLSHYLVPQMTRDSYRSAIMGPLSQTDAKISPDVLQDILNNVGDKTDQLPVLQHLMMQLYNYWKNKRKSDQPISIYDYKAVGRLEDAISLHAERLYEQLSESEQLTCKRMFQAITESGADNKGIRRPTSIANIIKVTNRPKEEVFKVANLFRAEGNSFITPVIQDELLPESVLDITHEAVMRNWKRMKKWIEEESDGVQIYLRLVDASALYQSGKIGPWRPPELLHAIGWRDRYHPNAIWANQYNPAFARSMKFLEISETSYNEEERAKERARKRQIRRAWTFAIVLAFAAVIAIGFMINSIYLKNLADNARQEAVIQRERAEENYMEAEKQRNLAEQYSAELEVQKAIVEANFLVASDERDVARVTANQEFNLRSEAELDLAVASTDLEVARQTTDEALEEKARIEREQAETFRENMILLGQTVAVNSVDIREDTELQALLALQAYNFNRQYRGPSNISTIYLGLRKSLENLNVNYRTAFPGHRESVRSLVYGPRNKWLFSAGSDGRLLRWNQFDGSPEPEQLIQNNTINRILALSGNEKWLVCAAEGLGIQVFDLSRTIPRPEVYHGHQDRVRSISIFNDNRTMLTSGMDNVILQWDLDQGTSEVFRELDNPVLSLANSADDQWVAAGTRNGKLLLFRTDINEPAVELYNEPGNQILSLVFLKSSNLLVSGDQRGFVRIWSLQNRNTVFRRKLHQARVLSVTADPSERYIATSSTDGRVYVIDLQNQNQQAVELANLPGFVYAVAFTDEGEHLAVGSKNTNPLIGFPVRMSELAGYVCPNITRNLTRLEWNIHIGTDISYEETCR